jgi:hypothetical protein
MQDDYRSRSFGISRALLAPVFLLALVLASPGFAQLFELDLEAGAESQGSFESSTVLDSGSSTVSLSHSVDLDGADGLAKAAAGPGSVAVFGRAQYSVLDPSNDTASVAIATAISTIDDVVFAGSGTLNNLFLTMDLSGSMSVNGTTDVGLSTLSLSVKLNNQTVNGFRTVQLPLFFFADGPLAAWSQGATSYNDTIVVGPFDNVPTNVPVTVRVALTIAASAQLFQPSLIGNAAIAKGDIGNTLSFTSSGAVFTATGDLTSVDSVQGSIEAGLFTGTPVSVPADAVVPALSTPMVLLLALLMGAGALLFPLRPRAA